MPGRIGHKVPGGWHLKEIRRDESTKIIVSSYFIQMKLLKKEVVPRPSGVSGKRRKDWVRLGEHQHQGAVDGAVCVPGSCGC